MQINPPMHQSTCHDVIIIHSGTSITEHKSYVKQDARRELDNENDFRAEDSSHP